jgi:hypothetical protein
MVRGFGVVCCLFALGILFFKEHTILFISVAIGLLLLSPLFFVKQYIHLNSEKQTITEEINFFLFKSKTPLSLNTYSNITILKQLYKESFHSKVQANIEDKFYKYELILLNANHLKKYKLALFNTYEEAKIDAEKLASSLNFPIVAFNPQNSRRKR